MSPNHRFARRTRSAFIGLLLGVSWASASSGCSTQAGNDAGPSGSSKPASSAAPTNQPAGPEELALVAPLVVGGSLDGFEVTEIQAIHKGVLNVAVRKERVTVRLWIAVDSEKAPKPPAVAGKYAVFYSVRSGDPAEAERLAKALAQIVEKHADIPPPKGMTEFVPAGISL